jgi:hypothetical protein
MELHDARTIVKTLAQGVDPITGEVFTPDSPYNHPQVIRALFTVHQHLRLGRTPIGADERRRLNLEHGRPKNAGLPWTDEGRAQAALGFRNGKSIGELAAALERSRSAIHAELIRQELVASVAS